MNIHLIAIGGSAMHNLAIALKKRIIMSLDLTMQYLILVKVD